MIHHRSILDYLKESPLEQKRADTIRMMTELCIEGEPAERQRRTELSEATHGKGRVTHRGTTHKGRAVAAQSAPRPVPKVVDKRGRMGPNRPENLSFALHLFDAAFHLQNLPHQNSVILWAQKGEGKLDASECHGRGT